MYIKFLKMIQNCENLIEVLCVAFEMQMMETKENKKQILLFKSIQVYFTFIQQR